MNLFGFRPPLLDDEAPKQVATPLFHVSRQKAERREFHPSRLFDVPGQRHRLRAAIGLVDVNEETRGFCGPFWTFPNGPSTARFGDALIRFDRHGRFLPAEGIPRTTHKLNMRFFVRKLHFCKMLQ